MGNQKNNIEHIQDNNQCSAGEVTSLNSTVLRWGEFCNIFNSATLSRLTDPSSNAKYSKLLKIGIWGRSSTTSTAYVKTYEQQCIIIKRPSVARI